MDHWSPLDGSKTPTNWRRDVTNSAVNEEGQAGAGASSGSSPLLALDNPRLISAFGRQRSEELKDWSAVS
jgi:hypothetical protein